MGKILPIINVALAAIAMIVSIIVLLQVMGLKTAILEPEEDELNPKDIPISQLEEFNMEDSFILSFDSIENPDKKINIVLKLGFALNKEDENIADAKTTLTSQGKIIRDKISNLMNSKNASYFTDTVKQDELKAELLALVKTLVGNDAIVEVYFADKIIAEK
ncbi:MAG: flagellar basal body-associated FliL family protein [Vallitaleaceae bacterium]|nr:flagellar basal body-associated FliL family protein [Vallitaleaceae bacterium]